jgi:HK97 family phage portal protein
MGLSAFYGAVRILSNSLGKLPIHVYKDPVTKKRDDTHAINRLLNLRANNFMASFTLRKSAMIQSLLYGCAYIAVFFDATGRPSELLLMPSDATVVYIYTDGTREYETTINNVRYRFDQDSVIELPWLTYDGQNGVGLLRSAKETLSTEYSSQQYAGKFYRNGARISGIVETQGDVSWENKEKLRAQFEETYSGLQNAFRVGVLDFGMKYTPLGIPQKDAQYIESRNFTVEEVSRVTGVPLHKLQSGKQSYNSNEQQGLEYVVDTLLPIVTLWEQELGYKLFLGRELNAGYYLRFNVAAEMRGDNKSRAEYYDIMIRNGIYSINECRDLEEKDGITNGDEHFITRNYMSVSQMLTSDPRNEKD